MATRNNKYRNGIRSASTVAALNPDGYRSNLSNHYVGEEAGHNSMFVIFSTSYKYDHAAGVAAAVAAAAAAAVVVAAGAARRM